MPLSTVTSNLVRFGIQVGLFILVYVYYAIIGVAPTPNWYLFLAPVLVVMMAGLALGFGIVISSMTTKYRDLQVLFTFIVQLWMYATPIVYPLSQVAGKTVLGMDLTTIMSLNPVTPIIETFKYGALGAGEFIGWGWLAYSFVFMLVVLSLGILIFNKVQKSFMDTV
jgi:lipopolysaccharide transport system permease protein